MQRYIESHCAVVRDSLYFYWSVLMFSTLNNFINSRYGIWGLNSVYMRIFLQNSIRFISPCRETRRRGPFKVTVFRIMMSFRNVGCFFDIGSHGGNMQILYCFESFYQTIYCIHVLIKWVLIVLDYTLIFIRLQARIDLVSFPLKPIQSSNQRVILL